MNPTTRNIDTADSLNTRATSDSGSAPEADTSSFAESDVCTMTTARATVLMTAFKRNRFIALDGATKSVNRDLEAKARALAGIKGYTTNITNPTPEFVIGSYAALWRIEKSFRMSKHDLRARPIYHHKRESIDAHLNIVFAALAVTRLIEARTSWSIKKFVQTARRYRTVQIRAGNQLLTATDPIPAELREALAQIT